MNRHFCFILFILSGFFYPLMVEEPDVIVNGGFESGDLVGWSIEGDVTIVQDDLDSFTDNSLHKVGDGSYSAQIGDDIPWGREGPQRSSIFQEVIVPSPSEEYNKTVMQFSYAVVANDPPSHNKRDKPLFRIVVTDTTTSETLYDTDVVFSSQTSGEWYLGSEPKTSLTQRGFSYLSDDRWVFRAWQSVDVDLSDRVGNYVRLEFIVRDCNLSAHAAYGYLDSIHVGKPQETTLPPLAGSPRPAPFLKPTFLGSLFRIVEKLRLWPGALCCIPLLPLLLIALLLSRRRKRDSTANLPSYIPTYEESDRKQYAVEDGGGGGFRPMKEKDVDPPSGGGFRPG